jgi:hypothetical protein
MVYRGSPRQVYDHATHQKKHAYPHPLMAAPTAFLAVGWLLPMMMVGSWFHTVTAPLPSAPVIKPHETIVV